MLTGRGYLDKRWKRWRTGVGGFGFLVVLLGCAACARVEYTPLSSAEDIPPPVRHTILLTSAASLDREVVELGVIKVHGRADPSYLLQKMREKAREVGADAVYKIEGVGDLAPLKAESPPKDEEGEAQSRKLERPQLDLDRGISFSPRLVVGVAVRYK